MGRYGDFVNLEDALLLLFTHGLPILFFAYMATDVLLNGQALINAADNAMFEVKRSRATV